MGAAGRQCGVWALLLAVWFWPGGAALWAERVALVEVLVQQDLDPRILQGQVLQESLHTQPADPHHEEEQDHPDLAGDLRLIRDEDEGSEVSRNDDDDEEEDEEEEEEEGADEEQKNPWIGVVPVEMEEGSAVSNGNQESFAAAVVNKMKRALVLGASALIILVLNQNTVREMDLSQVLSKPVIIIQTSENVTKLIGALLRGLHATAKITYKTFLQNNLGATLTLWSSCGRSRGGLYGEWQGVICTGETNSPVQKYLQQLWNTVVLVALILSTGVIVHARWQYQDNQFNDDLQLHPKQDLLKHLSSLKTRTYRQPKAWTDPTHGQPETDSCAVCLEQYNNNQCLRVLPCLHEFHRDCVDPWLLLQQTCPLCKRSVFGNFC
ncbi:RING finger protein 215 isoform X1 [Salminus brasiliensis]|uniref:RING finger protein 215 isoform X1 n=1 Tax=Salminus brasiliensis TaxID=930266 RepID=UPI003B838E84